MSGTRIKAALGALVLGLGVAAMSTSAIAQGKILRADTDAQGGPGHVMVITASKVWKRDAGLDVQVNDSQTLTRSALKLAAGKLEVMPFPTTVYSFMSKGSKMYAKKFKDQAIAGSKKVRSLYGWLAVVSHPITFEDSGIRKWSDIKGKRIFVGPPSGGAAVNSMSFIRHMTGFEPNKDYEAVRMPWGAGLQAMLDGKLDLYFRPSGLGSAVIEQIGLKKKIYIVDAKTGDPAGFQKWIAPPHRYARVIPAGTYTNQINNDVDVLTSGGTFQLAVNDQLSDDLAYKMTKSIWDNLEELQKTAAELKSLDPKQPFLGINIPLHKGAIKYYEEKGIEIPARLKASS